VEIIHDRHEDLRITSITCSSSHVTAQVTARGKSKTSLLATLSKDAPPGILRGELRLIFNLEDLAPRSIPVRAFITTGK
jgi:hypothetical protein